MTHDRKKSVDFFRLSHDRFFLAPILLSMQVCTSNHQMLKCWYFAALLMLYITNYTFAKEKEETLCVRVIAYKPNWVRRNTAPAAPATKLNPNPNPNLNPNPILNSRERG